MEKHRERSDPASCFNKASESELLFVLLGRDVAAPAAIRAWAMKRITSGKNKSQDPQILEALELATQIENELATHHG